MAVAENFGEACPASAPFFGYMGAAAALIFASACPARRVPRSRCPFWRALVPEALATRTGVLLATGRLPRPLKSGARHHGRRVEWYHAGGRILMWAMVAHRWLHASWGVGTANNLTRRTRRTCGAGSRTQLCARTALILQSSMAPPLGSAAFQACAVLGSQCAQRG